MENASRALVISGAVLVAVIIMGFLIYMFHNATEMKNQEINEERQRQIMLFNKEYESYNKKLMRGTDVITVMNMANNYNSKNAWDMNKNFGNGGWNSELKIDASVILKSQIVVAKESIKDKISDSVRRIYKDAHINLPEVANITDITMDTRNQGYKSDDVAYIFVTLDEDNALKEFKRKFFRCSKLDYSKITGLVNKIEFIEIDVGTIPGY